MPPLTLHPVRLPDATLATGAEYTIDNAGDVLRTLPEVVRRLEEWTDENARPAIQLALAATSLGARVGLNLVVKGARPEVAEAQLLACLGSCARAALSGVARREGRSDVVSLYPMEDGRWYYLRRAYIREEGAGVHQRLSGLEYFFSTADAGCALDIATLSDELPAGSGLLLTLFPRDRAPQERAMILEARNLPAGEAFHAYYASLDPDKALGWYCAIWASSGDDAERVRRALSARGVGGILSPLPGPDLLTAYEAALNPWGLHERLAQCCGHTQLGRILWSTTHAELAAICAGSRAEALDAAGRVAPALRARLTSLERDIGLPGADADTAGQILARLDSLTRRLDEQAQSARDTAALFDAVRGLRADVLRQGDDLRGQIETRSNELLQGMWDGIQEMSRRLEERIASATNTILDLLQKGEDVPQTAALLRETVPELNAPLDKNALALLQVGSERELTALGVNDDIIEALRFCISLHHIGEQMEESSVRNYVFFTMSMGYLYEAVALAFFKKNLYDHEPDRKADAAFTLKELDLIPNQDRLVQYTEHASLRGIDPADTGSAVFWAAWFNVMGRLRRMRNASVHNTVNRNEMQDMFFGLFTATNQAKRNLWNSSGDGFKPWVPSPSGPPYMTRDQVCDMIMHNRLLAESSFWFLMNCREAEWR